MGQKPLAHVFVVVSMICSLASLISKGAADHYISQSLIARLYGKTVPVILPDWIAHCFTAAIILAAIAWITYLIGFWNVHPALRIICPLLALVATAYLAVMV